MTPKEQYEARKAERKARADILHNDYNARQRIEQADILDMLDRFVTAVEQIAATLSPAQDRGQGRSGTRACSNGNLISSSLFRAVAAQRT